jgi:hypothetical protein
MSNNNSGNIGIPTNVINQGFSVWQNPANADVQLLLQQITYAEKCQQYIANIIRLNSVGKDISNQVQTELTALSQSIPMTTASASAYFPGINSGYWSACVVDYYAGYNAIINSGL